MNKFVESTQIYVLSKGLSVVKIGVAKKYTDSYLYIGPLKNMPNEFKCDHTLIQGCILFNDGSLATSLYDQDQKQHLWNYCDI